MRYFLFYNSFLGITRMYEDTMLITKKQSTSWYNKISKLACNGISGCDSIAVLPLAEISQL